MQQKKFNSLVHYNSTQHCMSHGLLHLHVCSYVAFPRIALLHDPAMHDSCINYVFFYMPMPWPVWWGGTTFTTAKSGKISLDNSKQVGFLSLKAKIR